MNEDNKLFKPIIVLAFGTGFLLLIPLIAMQFSDEVVWTLSDFIVAGSLLFGTGLAYILVTRLLATRMAGHIVYRVAVGFALFTGLFLIWTNLAVGIIGHSGDTANLMYFGIPVIGIIGGLITRFRPRGMSYTMFSMAIAQASAAAIVLIGGMYQTPPSAVIHILGVNGFFITLFVTSALLFRYADREQPSPNTKVEG